MTTKEEIENTTKNIGKVALWIAIIWMAFGVYGFITFIGKFL